jgi:ketosteroid isomerase-like protein
MKPANSEKPGLPRLPKAVEIYLTSARTKDVERLALCFADDALVHDESHDYRGIAAIQKWKQETEAKYRYVMEPLEASVTGNFVNLRARLTGEFPGSPVDLDYTFVLANEKITSLEIH